MSTSTIREAGKDPVREALTQIAAMEVAGDATSEAKAWAKAWQRDRMQHIANKALASGNNAPTAAYYEHVLADHRRLVRELDVALNGEAGAAKQASLCDIVAQVKANPPTDRVVDIEMGATEIRSVAGWNGDTKQYYTPEQKATLQAQACAQAWGLKWKS